jgi:hypothetical protein
MKKITTKMMAILLVTIVIISCKKEKSEVAEPNVLAVEEISTNEATMGFASTAKANICCFTPPTNITRDANFTSILPVNLIGCNDLKNNATVGFNTNWFAANYAGNSPKVGVLTCAGMLAQGACDTGYISFKGNKTNGESITQNGHSILVNQIYHVQFNARIRPGSVGNAKVAIRLSNAIPSTDIRGAAASFSPNFFKSIVITEPKWRCFKFDIQDNSSTYSVINIAPFNQFTGSMLNYAKVDIDNVKIWQ